MKRSIVVIAAAVGVALALPGVAGAQAPPKQDSVVLTDGPGLAGQFRSITLNATSGPSGENPTGQVGFEILGFTLSGPVTCLAVSGNTATINFEDQSFGITTVQVAADRPGETEFPDVFDAIPVGRAPTDCSPLPPSGFGGALEVGDITVIDAAPSGTGQPNNPSCVGQTASGYVQSFGGARNAADAFNLTLQEAHNTVLGVLCGRTSGLVPIH